MALTNCIDISLMKGIDMIKNAWFAGVNFISIELTTVQMIEIATLKINSLTCA